MNIKCLFLFVNLQFYKKFMKQNRKSTRLSKKVQGKGKKLHLKLRRKKTKTICKKKIIPKKEKIDMQEPQKLQKQHGVNSILFQGRRERDFLKHSEIPNEKKKGIQTKIQENNISTFQSGGCFQILLSKNFNYTPSKERGFQKSKNRFEVERTDFPKAQQIVKKITLSSGKSFFEERMLKQKQKNYFQKISLKAFKAAFNTEQIDYLNYFKLHEYEQHSSYMPYSPIENFEELKQFLLKRKNKLRKPTKYLLHTACQSCLSPYWENDNKILNCFECKFRIHARCWGQKERCGRCVYKRLTNEKKGSFPQCFICKQSGLVPKKVGRRLFAHIFCLFSHNLWKVQQNQIQMKAQNLQNLQRNSLRACSLCKQLSPFIKSCKACSKKMHVFCAFIQGADIKYEEEEGVQIFCCENEKKSKMLSFKRKFILNYRNFSHSYVKNEEDL